MSAPSSSAEPQRFGRVEIGFHWLTFALASGLVASGLTMTRLPPGSGDQFALYRLHKAVGVTLLLVVVARIGWRLARAAPAWPPGVPPLARAAARAVHTALYLSLVAVPLAGWALVSASTIRIPTSVFGLATWPDLPVLSDLDLAGRARVQPLLAQAHALLAYGFIGLVFLHGAAALWHGRRILARMVPGLAMRRGP